MRISKLWGLWRFCISNDTAYVFYKKNEERIKEFEVMLKCEEGDLSCKSKELI
nr:hypothetical protein RMONA_1820 [Rickettsia monacensis IrR/Munich]